MRPRPWCLSPASGNRPAARLRLALALAAATVASAAVAQPYRDAALPVDARVADLLPRLTPEEKFWQLFMLAGGLDDGLARYEHGAFGFQLGSTGDGIGVDAIQRHFVEDTRLGIPVIIFGEALHGLVRPGATAFPQAIGLAATFDTGLMHEVARAIALECRAAGVRQVLSPVVNLADDVRWGRVEETYGEDPCLTGEMGVAFVTEFERLGIVTTPKHLVANVGDGGRDSYPIHLGERRLRERQLQPFAACILRGGSRSVMTAYNSLDGIPCTASAWLNQTWLKDELGFGGFVISDAGAVGGAMVLHVTAAGYDDAAAQALRGGLDVIFQTAYDHAELFLPAFLDGRIPPAVIDAAVARVLRAKFELGLFEQPYVGDAHALAAADLARHRELARRAARESIVLLENPRGLLPLALGLTHIAVLGPDAAEARLGGYSGPGNHPVSLLEGIRRRVGPSARVTHAQGCPRLDPGLVTIPTAFLSCEQDGAPQPGLLGAYFDNVALAGEPVLTRVDPQVRCRWTLASPAPDHLAADFYSVRWTGKLRVPDDGSVAIGVEGDDGYRLYLDGALVLDAWRPVSSRSLLAATRLVAGREYDLRLEFRSPTGRAQLRLVWDRGQPADRDAGLREAVALAAAADLAVVAVGLEEGEFRDRASLRLPGRQDELIRRVADTGTPTVVVLVGGSAVAVGGWRDRAAAVLQVWYPGEAGGEAVADVLFGDADPAGRLPFSVPIAEGQLPLTYDHAPTGRGDDYLDLTGQPQYPFGYGLSYTRFEYADLRLERTRIAADDSVAVSFTLRNVGPRDGDEVVQLYLHDELASSARPVTALEAFQRVHLAAGEATTVRFVVGPDQLALLGPDLRPVVEPGAFRLMIGASCRDIRLRGILHVGE
ncbi:MAG: glycoside hydrolase family 3 C-terminal domain-containing protein [Candidatus Krumholzibacteriia bacterium]